ncbi:hypothetical protein C8Q77DRAFT_1158485 [Trametes polyzona]|nr:hypothetical protein C8Q77DRAFT_1158485 [Trametes polyzona]
MAFEQPLATPIQTHIIESIEDWERFSPGLSSTLRLLESQPDAVEAAVSKQASKAFSDDQLYPCMLACDMVVDRLHAQSRTETRLPHLGRDPRTTIIGSFAMDVLKQVIPKSQAHFDALYARAIYPCQVAISAARWVLPQRGRATSILTYPIPLPVKARLPTPPQSPGGVSDTGGDEASLDDQGSDWRQEELQDDPTSLYSSISGALFDRYGRPLGNAHLLSRHVRSQDHASLAILCVAAEDEIYDLMCSALMQRNAFGFRDTVIGLTFSPHSSHLQLIVGWLEDSASHACVDVHVAHARAPNDGERPVPALGIFDLAQRPSAWALVLFLISIRELLLASADAALRTIVEPYCPLRNVDKKTWRIDLLHKVETEAVGMYGADPDQRVKRWLSSCAPPAPFLSSSPPLSSTSMPPSSSSRPSRDPSTTPSQRGSLPPISEDAVSDAYVWNDPQRQQDYNSIKQALPKDVPLVMAVRQRGSRSASSLAASKATPNGVDRLTEYFIDRGVSFDPFPPIFYSLADILRPLKPMVEAWKALILPRICGTSDITHNAAQPLPSETLEEAREYITDFNIESRTISRESTVRGYHHESLKPRFMLQWFEYIQEKALEQIVRSGHKLQLLTGVDDATREIIARALPQVLSLSEVTACGSLDVPVEMESRQTWDAVIHELLGGLAGKAEVRLGHAEDKSKGSHRLVPYRTHSRLERRIYSPKNSVFEAADAYLSDRYATTPQPIIEDFARVHLQARRLQQSSYQATSSVSADAQPSPSDTGSLIRRLVAQTGVALDRHVHAVNKVVNDSTWNRKAAKYLGLAETSTEDTLAARAFCDFEYSICDGVVFVEIPDVFDTTDDSFAEKREEFAVIGNPELARQANMKKDADADMEPAPGDKLSPSCPEIVLAIREFATEIREASPSHAQDGKDAARHTAADLSATGSTRSLQESLSNLHITGSESTQASAMPSTAPSTGLPPVFTPRMAASQIGPQAEESSGNKGVASKTTSTSVCLPILFREYKRSLVNPLQGMNQARIYILSATAFYASLDMYGVVVFAVATVGSKGRLLCGWAEKAPKGKIPAVVHRIIDSNCPEWDLGNSSDAIDFATFLALLRTKHIPDVVARFEATREAFVNDWRNGNRERFHWTMASQKKYSKAYSKAQARWQRQESKEKEKIAEMEALKKQDQEIKRSERKRPTAATSTPPLGDEAKQPTPQEAIDARTARLNRRNAQRSEST